MIRITQAERAEWRALCKAATPGPWKHYAGKLRPQFPTRIHEVQRINGPPVVKWAGFDGVSTASKNATFIAAARTALPRLLDALDALEAEKAAHNCDEATQEFRLQNDREWRAKLEHLKTENAALRQALQGCERYALRIDHDHGHPMDRENARGILHIIAGDHA